MSRKGVICAEPIGKCDLCGAKEETRPYGPRGEDVCFTCGMKDKEAARRNFRGYVLGDTDD